MAASFHEEIAVDLRLRQALSPGKLNRILRGLGATLDYDVYSFDRDDRHPIWQSESFASVDLLAADKRVDAQDTVDHLRLTYPMATIPATFIPAFADLVFALATELGASVTLEGQQTTREGIVRRLDAIASELMSEWGEEPGSEALAIMIEQSLARR